MLLWKQTIRYIFCLFAPDTQSFLTKVSEAFTLVSPFALKAQILCTLKTGMCEAVLSFDVRLTRTLHNNLLSSQ